MRIFLFFIFGISALSTLFAQDTIVKIDLDKRKVNLSTFPSDKKVSLEIASKNYTLGDSFDVYEIKVRKGKKYIAGMDKDIYPILEKLEDSLNLTKEEKDSLTAKTIIKARWTLPLESKGKGIYNANIPFLHPNKRYEIVLTKKPSDKEIKYFLDYHKQNSTGVPRCELKQFYEDKILGIERIASTDIYQSNFYLKKKSIKKEKEKERKEKEKEKEKEECWEEDKKEGKEKEIKGRSYSTGKIAFKWIEFDTIHYPILKKILENFETKFQTDVIDIPTLKDVKEIGERVVELKLDQKTHSILFDLIDKEKITEALSGYKLLGGSKPSPAIGKYDYIKRRNNIKANLETIKNIEKQIVKIITLDNTSYHTSLFKYNCLDGIKTAFDSNNKLFVDMFKLIRNKLNPDYSFVDLVGASSISSDIKAQNGRIIVPDFGLINIFTYNNKGTIGYIPRFYFGVNFHFGGGIDRNTRIRDIPYGARKRFWLRSSLALGITAGKIDEKGFSNLIGDFSPTLGYSYRVEDQIRVGCGVAFLKEKNPNIFINKEALEPAVFINVTFDFNIFSELGTIGKKAAGL